MFFPSILGVISGARHRVRGGLSKAGTGVRESVDAPVKFELSFGFPTAVPLPAQQCPLTGVPTFAAIPGLRKYRRYQGKDCCGIGLGVGLL